MFCKVPARYKGLVGVLLSIVAAWGAASLFAEKDVRIYLPLWFVAVLFVLALRYGLLVGVVGSLASALIFARMLFEPVGSWRINADLARQNLAWMILGGIALSYLFAPSDSAEKP